MNSPIDKQIIELLADKIVAEKNRVADEMMDLIRDECYIHRATEDDILCDVCDDEIAIDPKNKVRLLRRMAVVITESQIRMDDIKRDFLSL